MKPLERKTVYLISSIKRLRGSDACYGKGMYGMDLTGYTKRQADAFVRDHIAGGSTNSVVMEPTNEQRSWLAKYGYDVAASRLQTQALMNDIMEQLDRDVIRFEDLHVGAKVVHVRAKRELLVIRSLKAGEKCKFEETSYTASPRMLRLFRVDGDYGKCSIPQEYFWRNWLER